VLEIEQHFDMYNKEGIMDIRTMTAKVMPRGPDLAHVFLLRRKASGPKGSPIMPYFCKYNPIVRRGCYETVNVCEETYGMWFGTERDSGKPIHS